MMHITRALMDALTEQDAFDIVAYNLLRQNERSIGRDGIKCLYRAPDGRRCAIGWLMPDDVYNPGYEGNGVSNLSALLFGRRHESPFARMLDRLLPLLRSLQEVHDARRPDEWAVALRVVAQLHHLSEAVVDHCERVFAHRPARRAPDRAMGYLLTLAGMPSFPPFVTGVDHGREERKASRETVLH